MSGGAPRWTGDGSLPLRRFARALLLLSLLLVSALPAMANGDFTLQMFDNPSPVDRGSDLTFQANVSRSSGNADHNIPVGQTLSFVLPANLSFVSISSSSSYSCVSPAVGSSGITVTCQVVSAIYGSFETVTLVTNTTTDAAVTRTMTASLANPDDTNPADNFASTTTPVTTPRTPTTTVTTSSQQQSVFGESVTFTATVTGTGATPTGLLAFFIDGNPGSPITLDANGKATFTTSTLSVGNHPVCANYLGDSDNLPSCGPLPGGQEVNAGSTTTSLTSSQNPSLPGETVTFTATVGVVAPSAGTPTGTVTFSIDGTPQAPVPLAGTTATLSTSSLALGNHSVTAEYSGDGDFDTSTSAVLDQAVALTATSTALTSSFNPSNVGQSVTFTATVAASSGTPTGTVTFSIDGTDQAPVPLAGGSATLTTATLAAGGHAILATYSGDATFATSASTTLTQTIGLTATTTALASSLNPSNVGQGVTFTATVAAASGTPTALASSLNPSNVGQGVTFTATVAAASGTPTGTVTFSIDGTDQAPVSLAGGTATLSTATLAAGSHTIVARYDGDSAFASSTSNTLDQTVAQTATTTALASSLNPSDVGQGVTFTAAVSASSGTPTGTVTFVIDGTPEPPVALAGGSATLTTASLTAGGHAVTASYSGDAAFAASASATLTQTVGQIATTTALTSSVNPSSVGETVLFVATVSSASGTPTGTVTFTVDGVAQAPVGLLGGEAGFGTSMLSAGSHAITASYNGDATFAASTSATLNQAVGLTATTTALASSVNPSNAGDSVTFTAAVTAPTGSPTGAVTFSIDGTAQAPVAIAGGSATLTTAALTAGSHTITASYGGDTNFSASTSPSLTQSVGQIATTTALTSTPNPSLPGELVNLTASVSSTTGAPTGTVTFSIDFVPQTPVPLVGGIATLPKAFSFGPHVIGARFSGGANFAASQASNLVQNVVLTETTMVLTSSLNPSILGDEVTFTARVDTPRGTATGVVDFDAGGGRLARVPLSNGIASYTTDGLPAGRTFVFVSYDGDATHDRSSANLIQTVNQIATTTTLISSRNPSAPGERVTITANVSAASVTPTGPVDITIDGTSYPASLVNGSASVSIDALSIGSHTVRAFYNGGGVLGLSQGELTQVVALIPTTTTLVSSLNPSNHGNNVTFTANVDASSGTPTGSVSFIIDGEFHGGAWLANGSASFSTSTLASGTHAVIARYDGDVAFDTSTSAPLSQEVRAVPGTIVLREVTDGPDASFGFSSPTGPLNVSVVTSAGQGETTPITVPAGTHVVTADDTRAQGVALTALACSDNDSVADVAARTATIALAPGESVVCTFTSTDTRTQTTELIDNFLATRADLILSNQPDTERRIDRLNGMPATTGDPMGAFMGYLPGLAASSPLSVSTSLNALNRMTGAGDPESPFDIWFKGTYASLDTDTGGGKFGLATFGADYVFNRDLLLGAIVQIDRLSLDRPGSSVSGTGWLAGPYVTARLAPSVFLDVVAAAGTSANTISPFGTYSDDFDTTRWMVQAALKGEWTRDAWTFSPGARLGYFSDGSQAYVDSVGVAIPDVSVALGQFAISPEISYRFETQNDVTVDTRLKFEGIYDFTEDDVQTGFGDLHGRVEAGVDFTMKGGMRLGLATAYDGIGSSDLTAIGGTVKLSVPLN